MLIYQSQSPTHSAARFLFFCLLWAVIASVSLTALRAQTPNFVPDLDGGDNDGAVGGGSLGFPVVPNLNTQTRPVGTTDFSGAASISFTPLPGAAVSLSSGGNSSALLLTSADLLSLIPLAGDGGDAVPTNFNAPRVTFDATGSGITSGNYKVFFTSGAGVPTASRDYTGDTTINLATTPFVTNAAPITAGQFVSIGFLPLFDNASIPTIGSLLGSLTISEIVAGGGGGPVVLPSASSQGSPVLVLVQPGEKKENLDPVVIVDFGVQLSAQTSGQAVIHAVNAGREERLAGFFGESIAG